MSRQAIVYSAVLSGLPGSVLSWDYSHNGEAEELSVTVSGLYGLATPSVSLSAQARWADGTLLASLPVRSFAAIGQEPQEDAGSRQTTFRLRNSFNKALRGDVLPELIPWKITPTPENCGKIRQKISVSAVVRAALQDYGVALSADPLLGTFWEEGRSDFSTLNLSPQALWDATYGALGMVLHTSGAGNRLVGRPANPTVNRGGAFISEDWITELGQGRELLQTPTALTLKGGDFYQSLDVAALLQFLGTDPAASEVARELLPNQEWYDPAESAGTARTQRGYLKSGGQMVADIEITTDDVGVSETVDGKPYFRLWSGVATGYKRTTTRYDPNCPGRPTLQTTESKTWAFDAQTQGGAFSTTGPALYRNLQVGDLASDELTVTTYRYSPQGHLAAKTTSSRRLGSLKQQDAELAPEDRGPLQAREYISTTQTEQWQPIGGGRWLYTPGVSGQTLVAVYDAKSGEAVRTASVARSAPDVSRITDQAPPQYDCSKCDDLKAVQYATGVTLRTGDAGFAEATEAALAFIPPDMLISVARFMLANIWGRVVSTFTVPLPLGYFPGDWTSYGEVRELRISQAQGDPKISTTLTTVKPDNLLGTPGSAAVSDLDYDQNSGKATMLAGKPGGAIARIGTGWDVATGQPRSEPGFIAFRTGFPPRPGDEIDWQLVNGRREATNAR
ncbi:hypothetical protein ACI3L1_06755 [Deinococcus sp. SM5_A1]|uniref:hypothetical protein n=1 Tax=Deinococcus sp. SM5_A1 TaxID=3379094 RepID=UPI0038596B25